MEDRFDKFTCFSRLPIELRLKIWRTSMPLFRRVITISSLIDEKPRYAAYTIRTSGPLTLMDVNRESRSELKPFYETPFNEQQDHFENSQYHAHGNWKLASDLLINFQMDILFINLPEYLYHSSARKVHLMLFDNIFNHARDCQKIVHLAQPYDCWAKLYQESQDKGFDLWRRYMGVEEVFCVVDFRCRNSVVVDFSDEGESFGCSSILRDMSQTEAFLRWLKGSSSKVMDATKRGRTVRVCLPISRRNNFVSD